MYSAPIVYILHHSMPAAGENFKPCVMNQEEIAVTYTLQTYVSQYNRYLLPKEARLEKGGPSLFLIPMSGNNSPATAYYQ